MAMLFHDEKYLSCPKCGSTTMKAEKIYRFAPDAKEKSALNGEYVHTRICCSECGTIVRFCRLQEVRTNQ